MNTENIKVETDSVIVISIYFKRYKAIEKWEKMLNGYEQVSQENRQGLSIRFFCQFTYVTVTWLTNRDIISLVMAFAWHLQEVNENLEEAHFSILYKGARYYSLYGFICVFTFNTISSFKKTNCQGSALNSDNSSKTTVGKEYFQKSLLKA